MTEISTPPDGDPSVAGVDDSGTPDAGFAPAQLSDGRTVGEWRTRYADKSAQLAIRTELIYLVVVTLLCPAGMVLLALKWPEKLANINPHTWATISHYGYAWVGGMLGGSLFAMKWMYHSVAKGIWNQDRRLWRIFTPLLSAGVGFTVVVLSASRVLPLFGADTVQSNSGALAVSTLVGYFSDLTMSRLADITLGVFRKS